MRNQLPCSCEDCLVSSPRSVYHVGMTSPSGREKNPLVWGDDITFLDNSGEESYDSPSTSIKMEPEDCRACMATGQEYQMDGKIELTVANSLIELTDVTDKFNSLPESFDFFPKDFSKDEELNDILTLAPGTAQSVSHLLELGSHRNQHPNDDGVVKTGIQLQVNVEGNNSFISRHGSNVLNFFYEF